MCVTDRAPKINTGTFKINSYRKEKVPSGQLSNTCCAMSPADSLGLKRNSFVLPLTRISFRFIWNKRDCHMKCLHGTFYKAIKKNCLRNNIYIFRAPRAHTSDKWEQKYHFKITFRLRLQRNASAIELARNVSAWHVRNRKRFLKVQIKSVILPLS